MTKTLQLLSLATVLATGVATATLAASGDGANGSQEVTGTMTGSQQVGTPATDNTITTGNGPYTTGTPSTNVDPRKGSSGTGISAQSTGPQYPAVVGPTGSHQQDATNPNRSPPTGGTSEGGASGAGVPAAKRCHKGGRRPLPSSACGWGPAGWSRANAAQEGARLSEKGGWTSRQGRECYRCKLAACAWRRSGHRQDTRAIVTHARTGETHDR